MRAMLFDVSGMPLRAAEIPEPVAGDGELLLRVRACGVCRTDLHIVDGELTQPKLPLVLGHQIVGATWRATDRETRRRALARLDGRRLPLLPRRAREPLRPRAVHRLRPDGGYAEYAVADERFCFPLPDAYPDSTRAAPLRRPDRLPIAAVRRRRRAARSLRLRRGGAHHRAGRAPPGAARVRVHTAGRRGRPGVRARARRGVGRRIRRSAARGARRGDHLRAGRRARAGGAAAPWPRAAQSYAPVST